MNILMYGEIAANKIDRLKPRINPSWSIQTWDPAAQQVDEFAAMLHDADAIIGGPIPLDAWPETPNLKIYQVPWAGYDWASAANVPSGVSFCNCYEHEGPIAEYVLLTMLESRIGLRRMDSTLRARGWDGHGPGRSVFHQEIQGSTLGIIGYGHIGEEVARRAQPFGIRCIGVRRSQQPTPPSLDWLGTLDRLDEMLAQSDFVLIACDLNDETRGMVDLDLMKKMKDTGWLINVARGAIVNEDDLFFALTNNVIGGAIIDTWYNYPSRKNPDVWPANHPFQDLPNTIVSAHESGWTKELVDRRWQVVADNLSSLDSGQPLANLLFKGTARIGGPTQ